MARLIRLYSIGGLLTALMLLVPLPAAAQTPPDTLVKNVTEEVLSILREDKEIKAGNRDRAIELIETRIAPHFDFRRMTALAVGRAWREADEAEREALTEEFRKLLVRTYSNALTAYKDETVAFKPTREQRGDDQAIVRSQINRSGAPPIALEYRLTRKEGGEWKVFDVVVDSVSLVTSYRGTFASEVSSGGIEGLLRSLQAKNREPQGAAS